MTGTWWGDLLVALALAALVTWAALLVTMAIMRPRGAGLTEALRLLPDVLRLLRRLAADRTLPRGVRLRLVLLLAYLASPIDIVPDFIPVLGYADDAIIVAVVLRGVARRAGMPAVRAHWPGTPEGLAVLARLAGLPIGIEAAIPPEQSVRSLVTFPRMRRADENSVIGDPITDVQRRGCNSAPASAWMSGPSA